MLQELAVYVHVCVALKAIGQMNSEEVEAFLAYILANQLAESYSNLDARKLRHELILQLHYTVAYGVCELLI
jgi:hypothetical protein